MAGQLGRGRRTDAGQMSLWVTVKNETAGKLSNELKGAEDA